MTGSGCSISDTAEPSTGQDQRATADPAIHIAKWAGSRKNPADEPQAARLDAPNGWKEAAFLRVILPARAQPSRRCETQAPLSGKPPSCVKCFGPLTASARSGNLIAGDGTKNGPFPLRTKNQQKPKTNSLTGKAPYKFEASSLQRRVRRTSWDSYTVVNGKRVPMYPG
jgi:hypothetical protein